jgi:hypothetical protein
MDDGPGPTITTRHRPGHTHEEDCDCERFTVNCVASAEWPHLFHGVLDDVRLPKLSQGGYPRDVGTFRLSRDMGEIVRMFMFCGYSAAGAATEDGR